MKASTRPQRTADDGRPGLRCTTVKARAKRIELEKALDDAIKLFERETGCGVTGIAVKRDLDLFAYVTVQVVL